MIIVTTKYLCIEYTLKVMRRESKCFTRKKIIRTQKMSVMVGNELQKCHKAYSKQIAKWQKKYLLINNYFEYKRNKIFNQKT